MTTLRDYLYQIQFVFIFVVVTLIAFTIWLKSLSSNVILFKPETTDIEVVISYALYAKKGSVSGESCLSNSEYLISSILKEKKEKIKYVFSLIGDTQVPDILSNASTVHKENFISVVRTPQYSVGLFAHFEVLNIYLSKSSVKYFICLNCGSRGPYNFPSTDSLPNWIKLFVAKLGNDVIAVGPTISCEISPHIQTYAIAFNRIGARFAAELWYHNSSMTEETKGTIVMNSEIGLSSKILSEGYNIASLDHRFQNRDFRRAGGACDLYYNLEGSYRNPTRCDKYEISYHNCIQ